MEVAPHRDRAHRHRSIGQPLCHRDDVGRHPPLPRGRGAADAAERRDDFVEDQDDAVAVANFAQPPKIVHGRDQDARRSCHWLDDHRRDRVGAVQVDQPLEVVGQLGAVRGKTAREGVAADIVGVTQMIDAGKPAAERPAIVDQPPDADPAEAGAMIAALAPDQPRARPLPLRPLHRERDLQRAVYRLRPAVGEEYPVESFGHQRRQPLRQRERQRVPELESRREIERCRCLGDCIGDFGATMAGVAAPQPRRPVEDRSPVAGLVVHPAGRHELARVRLVRPIGRERHPE